MTLTTEQLSELTERINARLAEFGADMPQLSRGIVRMAHDVIEEWWEGAPKQWPQPPADDPVLDAYSIGFERGKEVAKPKPEPKFVTQTAPVAETVAATLGPEHVIVTPLKNGNGHHELPEGRGGNVLPDLNALIKEVKRISMGGTMPTQAQFNLAKPANWASATAHLVRLGISWEQLAEQAELKIRPRGSA